MTVTWMLGALAAGALLGSAAWAAGRAAGGVALPRRWVWAGAVGGSIALPLVALAAPGVLPHLRLPRIVARTEHRPAPAAGGDAELRALAARAGGLPLPRSRIPTLLAAAWIAVSLGTAGALAWSGRRLRASCGALVPRDVEGTAVLVAARAGPMVVGLLRPRIVLPRWAVEAPVGELRLIVAHEREHVRAGDAWLLALSALAVAAMPWSPALWWQHRRLRLAVETDCDARVLALGAGRGEYGRVLLRTASHPFAVPTLALAWGGSLSHLERRILAMTESAPRHRAALALPLAGIALLLAAGACGAASRGAPDAD